MFRYTGNKILEILTNVENTGVFPIALSFLSRMSIEQLIHSECLVCTCFQALLVWHFCMCTCLYPKHSFQRKHFAWLKVNSYKTK